MTLSKIFFNLLNLETMKTNTIAPNMVFSTDGTSAIKMYEAPAALRVTHLAPHAATNGMWVSWKREEPTAPVTAKRWIALPEELSIF